MNIAAVVQARMASTRLPGKVLMPFHGVPCIEWIVKACERAKSVSKVVVATSTNEENDEIAALCKRIGVRCFRGSEDDVLGRYIGLIDKYEADAVVRLTGDCPLADSHIISELIALYAATGVDYASNTEPPTFPDGLDTEVISARAIRAAHAEATRKSDRDCVTRWVVRNRHRFPAANLTCPLPGLHKERWVLDSPEDLKFIKTVFAEFGADWQPSWLDIHELLIRKPGLRAINAKFRRNERFFDGLVADIAEPKRFVESDKLFNTAASLIPFAAQTFSKSHLQFPAGETPLFVSHGDGGYCYDVDGNDFVDLVGALLPNVLGYRDPDIDWAVRQQLDSGASLSLATELEAKLASLLVKHIPCAEMVKFGKNGSDVTSAAVRLARAYTKREQVLTLGYHGWHDWALSHGPYDRGIPEGAQISVYRPLKALDEIEGLLRGVKATQEWGAGGDVACVIIEPEGWGKNELVALRELCTKHDALLIFDEIITGFRWSLGGYQDFIGVTPDLACFGKAIANGMPLSAIVGKAEYMKRFAPPDNIFYSGTFFGETLSLAAGIATIEKMEREKVTEHLWRLSTHLISEIAQRIDRYSLKALIQIGEAPLGRLKFSGDAVKTVFMKEMIQNGVLIIASHNLCFAHGKPEIDIILNAYDKTLAAINSELDKRKPFESTIAAKSVRHSERL